jgi:peptide/nickel transport system substrate-binding protein
MEVRLYNWLVLYPQFLNPSPTVVANVEFRRALMYATDRQQMVDTLEGGLSSVAHSFLSPGQAEYRDIEARAIRYEYDPRKAAEMLTALGFTKGADGMFRDAAGQRLVLEERTTGDNDIHRTTQTALADYWQRAGVGVDQVIVPIQRQRDREYRANYPAFDMLKNPNDIRALPRLHSSEARLPENSYVGSNYARYMVPEFDGLLDRYFVTIPRQARLQALGDLVHYISDQLNVMGLFYDTEPLMIGNHLRNVAPNPNPRSSPVWDIYNWERA